MICIFKNPFRVLGLPVTASNRDIVKRINELEMFVEMGKIKSYEMDCPSLPFLDRSTESIHEASSMLEQSESKFISSLFWFWNNNSVDELAIDLLQDGKYEKAISIWKKILAEKKYSQIDSSNLKNLYTLYLALSFANEKIDYAYLIEGIKYAGYFFSNGFVSDFDHHVNGSDISVRYDYGKISICFANKILESVTANKNGFARHDLKKIIETFQAFPIQTYQHSKRFFINEPVYNIKQNITRSRHRRTEDPENAYSFGNELYEDSIPDLESIENLVSDSDAEYQILADNLADEILQCSIDYFNELRDSDSIDPGDNALLLAEKSRNIVKGTRVEKRVVDTASLYIEWIDNKPERDKQKHIRPHIENIQKYLNLLPDIESIESAKINRLVSITINFIQKCMPDLHALEKLLGKDDDLYLEISSDIAGRSLVMCIEYANQTQEYANVLNVMKKILSIDMAPELRDTLLKNMEIINGNAENKEAENRYKKTQYHTDAIKKLMENLPNPDSLTDENILNLPDIIKEFLLRCSPNLANIKRITGTFDEFYVNVSSSVAGEALGMCVAFVNRTQKIHEIDQIMLLIGTMDMSKETRGAYLKNKDIIDQFKKDAQERLNEILRNSNKKAMRESKGGCYIATMVYEDYNSPEVRKLREFRDNVLEKYCLGRVFVTVYYYLSPLFVEKFKHNIFIRKIIKYSLQHLIKVVSI